MKAAGSVQRAGCYGVAGGLVHRQAFAGQGGFVHRRGPADYCPVHRDLLARTHRYQIAGADAVNGNIGDCAVLPYQMRPLGPQVHQAANGVRRPRQRACLQPASQQNQGDDDGRHIKVQSALGICRRQLQQFQHNYGHAVAIGYRSSHSNQGVHIGLAAAQPGPAGRIKWPAGPQLDRRRHRPQQQGIPPQGQQSWRPGQRGETAQQQGGGAGGRHHQPCPQLLFCAGPGRVRRRVGVRAGSIKPVAGVRYGAGQGGQVGLGATGKAVRIEADRCPLRSQVDIDFAHARHGAQGLAHMVHAGGAGHPGNGQHQRLIIGALFGALFRSLSGHC